MCLVGIEFTTARSGEYPRFAPHNIFRLCNNVGAVLCQPSVGGSLALRFRPLSASLATAAFHSRLPKAAGGTSVPALLRSMASLTKEAFALEVLL